MKFLLRTLKLAPALICCSLLGCNMFMGEEPACIPGESIACACADGSTSAQVCDEEGEGYSTCACGASSSNTEGSEISGYIVGGEQSREFAATGALVRGSESFCTATLIAPSRVLTAAHCVDAITPSQFRFRLGANLQAPSEDRGIASLTIHPGYVSFDGRQQWTFANGHDLAILTLDQPITSVLPASLFLGNASELLNQPARLIGYGGDQVRDTYQGTVLVGKGVRRASTVRFDVLTAQALRYVFQGMGACRGDSGGPAYIKLNDQWRQVGVTSWGDVRCVQYGHYQRLDLHADWIRETAGLGSSDPQPPSCDADGVCPGQCQLDEDCTTLLCPNGSCPASGGACASDGQCEAFCRDIDPDCRGNGQEDQGVDPCRDYGLYANGVCDPQCPDDPECMTMSTPPQSCAASTVQVQGNECVYLDPGGQICQRVPLSGLGYDPARRSCVVFDAAGTACGFAPAVFQYDQFSNVCVYFDPVGNVCGRSYPFCGPGGCSC